MLSSSKSIKFGDFNPISISPSSSSLSAVSLFSLSSLFSFLLAEKARNKKTTIEVVYSIEDDGVKLWWWCGGIFSL